jgi:hypothetical protein
VVSVAHDTGLQPVQVRRVCDCLFDQLSLLIEHDQSFTSPVLSFKVITKPDQVSLSASGPASAACSVITLPALITLAVVTGSIACFIGGWLAPELAALMAAAC